MLSLKQGRQDSVFNSVRKKSSIDHDLYFLRARKIAVILNADHEISKTLHTKIISRQPSLKFQKVFLFTKINFQQLASISFIHQISETCKFSEQYHSNRTTAFYVQMSWLASTSTANPAPTLHAPGWLSEGVL